MTSDPHPFGATWYAATMVEAPERPPLAHDLDVDVCVVGAGLAGLTVAREVARRGWKVAVLESRRIAWNASGRNAGVVSPGFAERIDTIIDRVGLPRAKELWALSQQGVEYVRAATEGMAGLEPQSGKLSVRRIDDEDEIIRLVAMLHVDFGEHAEVWPTEQVREVLRTPRYYQAVQYPSAFSIHPLNYALGLAAQAEAAGARIFEATPALQLDPEGVRKRIDTVHGRVRAAHVVLAGNVHLGALAPWVAETVQPMTSFMGVTQPLGDTLSEAVRYQGAVSDTRRTGNYYRVLPDGRLLWGMGLSASGGAMRRLKQMLRRDILRVYPQLSGVEIEHAWAGTLGYAVHRMPQVGELSPGYWLASAFGGHGLNTAAMAGQLIAGAILDGDDRWRLFAPYELVWAGGRAGRVVAQAVTWGARAREAVQERLSHRREAARQRSDEQAAARAAAEAARQAAEEQAQRDAEETMRHAEEAAARWAAQAEERKVVVERAAEVAGFAPVHVADAVAPVSGSAPMPVAPVEPETKGLEAVAEALEPEVAAAEAAPPAPEVVETSRPETAPVDMVESAAAEAVEPAPAEDVQHPAVDVAESAPADEPAKPKRRGGRRKKSPEV
jgi:glycine/D-amino acid oxidase-like deaminating enzyme